MGAYGPKIEHFSKVSNCPGRDYIDFCFLETQKIGLSQLSRKSSGKTKKT